LKLTQLENEKRVETKIVHPIKKPEPKPSTTFEIKETEPNQGLLWNWGTGQHCSGNQ
jgi:hypothetical protein